MKKEVINCEKCDELTDDYDKSINLCLECYEHEYCECGTALEEYAGEGFCKKCQ